MDGSEMFGGLLEVGVSTWQSLDTMGKICWERREQDG